MALHASAPTTMARGAMRFRIEGADRETGDDVTFELEADDVQSARAQANAAGFLVASAVPVLRDIGLAPSLSPDASTQQDAGEATRLPPMPPELQRLPIPHGEKVHSLLCKGELWNATFALMAATPLAYEEAAKEARRLGQGYPAAAKLSEELEPSHGRRAGRINCPHCGAEKSVTTSKVKRRNGLHGGKVAGALLTGGASMFVTGLSNKEWATHAHCRSCGADWFL
jgi:transcription elongation factor Elf1